MSASKATIEARGGAAKPGLSPWVRGLLITLLVFGGCAVLVVGSAVVFEYTAKELPLTAEDRRVLVTADRLAELSQGFTHVARHDNFRKRRLIDGSFEIEYEYDDEGDSAPYVLCTVDVEPSERDAREAYQLAWGSLHLGAKFGNDELTIEERNEVYKAGDASRFGVVKVDGSPIGNLFVARLGTKVLSLFVVGLWFDQGDEFKAVVGPALAALKTYEP
ncbi:MAG TPA: hypothetical protein VIK91_20530 [Nannocystis sp.]